jgi:hypothetical protein
MQHNVPADMFRMAQYYTNSLCTFLTFKLLLINQQVSEYLMLGFALNRPCRSLLDRS